MHQRKRDKREPHRTNTTHLTNTLTVKSSGGQNRTCSRTAHDVGARPAQSRRSAPCAPYLVVSFSTKRLPPDFLAGGLAGLPWQVPGRCLSAARVADRPARLQLSPTRMSETSKTLCFFKSPTFELERVGDGQACQQPARHLPAVSSPTCQRFRLQLAD